MTSSPRSLHAGRPGGRCRRTHGLLAGLLVTLLGTVALGGCGSQGTTPVATTGTSSVRATTATATGQAAQVSVADSWAKAAETGMTGAFATVTNRGASDVHIVSVASPAATRMELHETVADASGAKAMKQKQGGFVLPAGQAHVFAPGGDHFMFMQLTGPMRSGTTVRVTLTFADGSTLPFDVPVRTFAGAQETYVPGASTGTHSMPQMSPTRG